MKKVLSTLLAALFIFCTLALCVSALDNAVYISYNKGNNESNDGLSASSPKKSLGAGGGNGAIGLLDGGGTLVVSERFFIGSDYTWRTRGPVTITANDGSTDYKNPSPATNPASGAMKFASGATLTVESDLTIDDVILFQESAQNTFIVKDGATLTITDKVVTMSKQSYYTKIVVEKGGCAIVNGGTFSSVTGKGEIIIGKGATILGDEVGAVEEPTVSSGDNVCFLNYSGSNANDGFSPSSAVKGYTDGVFKVLKNGGTIVVCGKSYIAGASGSNEFTFPSFDKPLVFTSVYGGVDFKNPEPATNPACAFKLGSGTVLNIECDLVFDDIILFQENNQNKLVVKSGASLTINENVVTMSKQAFYFAIVVESGAKAIINGGTYSSITGDGDITIGEKVSVLDAGIVGTNTDKPAEGAQQVCFLDYSKGNDKNDGKTAETAVKSYTNGLVKILKTGGTAVVSGKSYIAGTSDVNAYSLPVLGGPITFTSVYNGVDYKNPEPANNPACAFKLGSGTVLNISSDVIFDNIILFQENNQNTIHVNPGATLIITDTVVLMTKPGNDYHFKVVVDSGAVAILSEEAQKVLAIEGEGDIITYVSDTPSTTEVKMTIGKTVGYINGAEKALDAAPIIREGRTMLPVRFVAEAFGANVGWDGATSTATVKTENVEIKITIGAKEAVVNGKTVALDAPAFIENGRTYMPVRFVAENLGATVAWDGATSTATLTK